MWVGTSESIRSFLSSHLSSQSLNHMTYDRGRANDRYAANAIVLPQMGMYSNLLPTDASAMLDHLTPLKQPIAESGKTFNKHWRGRYGCTESEQEELWAIKNQSLLRTDTTPVKEETREEKKVELKFKTYEGELRVVKASIGDTLLQVARANDLPSMEGSCGGNLGMSLYRSPLLFPSSKQFPTFLTSPSLSSFFYVHSCFLSPELAPK
jgi:hypothetical protein